MRLPRLLAAAVLAAAALPGLAVAQDAARGRELAATAQCTNCHGENGRSAMEGIPSLAGQQPGYITVQMILFREGIRQVDAMQAVARDMPDKDIEDLAAFFASLPPGPAEDRSPRDPERFAAGEALVAPRHCTSCHLPGLTGREQMPRLVGQREDFLARTLAEYRDGQRIGVDAQMNDAVRGLSDADIAALAHFLAHRD